MRIDAHQHYWKLERGDYGWLSPAMTPLYEDYMPDRLRPLLREQRIDRSIIVQAAPTVAETEFLLELCRSEPTVIGVVGWLDAEADHFAAELDRLSADRNLVGIRLMLQDIEDDAWVVRPQVIRALQLLAERDFPVDLLMLPRHMPYVIQALREAPRLRAVVDHLAKPPIRAVELEPWRSHLQEIAAYDGIYCKLSGMVTEADPADLRAERLAPYVHGAIEAFGMERVMFGSDWPVCLMAADYGKVCELLHASLPAGLSEDELARLFGGNALAFYKLDGHTAKGRRGD